MPPRRILTTLLTLALAAQAQGPTDKVTERYRQILEKTPTEGTALDRLWKSYLDAGKTEELIAQYRAGGTFASEMILGHLLRKAGHHDEAAAAFERAAALDPVNALPLFALAKLHTDAGHPREAAAVLERAITILPEKDSRKAETLLQLGAAWLGSGDVAKASEAWESAVALNPGDLDLRRRLAENYAKNSLADRAVPHLEYVAANAPPAERALALQQLARVHQGAGHQDEAIHALEAALSLTTATNWLRAELQSQLIRLHQRYHRIDELEARWKKFAEENPRDAGAHLQLIELYERLGRLEDQRAWLEKLVTLLPRNAEARLKLARLSVQMDRLGAATAIYDQLLAEQPANADYAFERARLDVQNDATDEARQRIAALLVAKGNDETTRARALEFYEQHRLLDLVEKHLVEDATGNAPEAISALANFYFAQRREADALFTLDRLAQPQAAPAEQAAAQLRIAQILRTENNLSAAVLALEKAVTLAPELRDCQMLLGELQATRGETAAAQAAFERAFDLSKTPAEEIEADQKLFESLRQQVARAGNPSGGAPGAEVPLLPNLALQHYLATLQGRAVLDASEGGWLRFARWQAWAGDQKQALLSAQKAVEVNPQSVAAYEFIVRQHLAEGTLPAAVAVLQRLMEIDPANRADYQRRAGQIELQAGRVAEALVIFHELTTANPGSIEALTDLALALQRGDRWTDALDAWRKIYALSPVSKKKEAFAPLLRALERLEMHGQAAELMFKAIETEPDEREQFTQFADLLAFCTKHDLLDWLRGVFERRRVVRADEYFTEMALGRILKATGNKAAAFEVLSDASYAAPNQAESLPELVREAEELRKLDAAVKLQAQLVRIARQQRPDGLEKLAQLQEKNFDIEEAAKTWDRIVARFPRNAEAVQRAIDFQIKWGSPERAIELLRKLRRLDPANLRALASLAELASEAGQTAEAELCLEELLRLAPAEKPGDPIRIPELKAEDAAQLQLVYRTILRRNTRSNAEVVTALRNFWSGDLGAVKSDRDFRLLAVRQLAQILQARGDRAALETWIARWREVEDTPNEAIWALYYAGAGSEALDQVEKMMARDPDDAQLKNAFIWLALQTRQFSRLNTWMNVRERTAAERDYLLVALDQHLQAQGRALDPMLLSQLFSDTSQGRLWDAAKIFEKRSRLREAVVLGQRVFDAVSTQRARYGVDLAGWYLRLGEVERAQEILRLSVQTTADSFDAPVYAALRAYWLLLGPGERAAFSETYLAGLEKVAHPLHRAIAGSLLHGLAGNEIAARADLERMASLGAMANFPLDDAGTSGARRWAFLLSAGLRLISWKLEPLAVTLWERSLADSALIELEGDMALETSREIRRRLFALRIASTTSPEAARESIDAYARVASKDGMVQLGETLDNAGAHTQAVLVYRQVWEEDPANAQLLRSLITACRSAQDTETAEAALTRVVEGGLLRGNEVAHHENLVQLAEMLESQRRIERARTLLREATEQSPRDSRLALRFAQLSERCGQPAEAIATYQRVLASEPRNFAAQLALSSALEAQGDLAAAIKVLQRSTSSEGESRMAQLRAKNGEVDDSLASLDRITAPQNVWPAINVAVALHEKGQAKLARAVLQNALDRNGDPRMRFPLQSKVVELLAPAAGEATILRELRRLRQLAGEQPELLSSYFDFAQRQSTRLGVGAEFQRELAASWADGTGPAAAGLTLLAAQLAAKDAAASATLDRLLAREDLGEIWLGRVAEALRTAGRFDLAVAVYAELAEVNPSNDEHVLDWARALHQAGRSEEARNVLGRLEALAVLSDELAGRLANAYATCGEPERARLFFHQAIRGDSLARNYPTHLAFARLQSAAQDFDGAKRTLRAAYSNPANNDFAAIIEWLAASGRIAQFGPEIQDFGLSSTRLTQLCRALFAHFEKAADLPQAIALLDFRAETIEPGMAARLRTMAQTARSFDAAAAVLEKLTAHVSEVTDLPVELARFYSAWAEAELEASNPTPAIAHLLRAHKLQPALFDIAYRLATVQAERSDRAGAIVTLDAYLAAASEGPETVKARALLTQLKGGNRP
jgi:tetratricopeptide (TPR) repeat protein